MNRHCAVTTDDRYRVSSSEARARSKLLFQCLVTLERGTPEHRRVRNALVELNLALVHFAAARFRTRSAPSDDVLQVGTIGLIKAVDRFDPDRAVEFPTFAVPTVLGEIRRFFRDTSWAVHVPRSLQELRLDLAKADDELTQLCGRAPTTAELAAHLAMDERRIREGLMAGNAYVVNSLDSQGSDEDEPGLGFGLLERTGDVDPALEEVENIVALVPLVRQLAARDRAVLALRFSDDMTQAQIGAELGISQMHVSRILNRTIARLRQGMLQDA
jgi:RNA polymerase sigma-B factor